MDRLVTIGADTISGTAYPAGELRIFGGTGGWRFYPQHGSSTTVFHSIFRPGSTHAKHLHSRCD